MTGYTNLYLYKNTKFYKHQNYKIDDINSFLATLQLDKLTFENLQYFRPDSITKEIKIAFNQKGIKSLHQYNYARVVIFNTDQSQEWELFYYVDKVEWLAMDTIKLHMTLDTLNSFLDLLEFHPKTFIEREHCDRWDYRGYFFETEYITLLRAIPELNEGLNPHKYNYVYDDNWNLTLDVVRKVPVPDASEDLLTPYLSGKGYAILERTTYISWLQYDIGDNEHGKTYSIFLPFNIDGVQPVYWIQIDGEESPTLPTKVQDASINQEEIIKISFLPYPPIEDLKDGRGSSNPLPDTDVTTNIKYTFHTSNETIVGPAFTEQSNISRLAKTKHAPIISDYISKVITPTTILPVYFNELPKKLLTLEKIRYRELTDRIIDNGHFRYSDYSNESAMYSSEFLDFYFFYDSFNYTISLEDIKFNGTQEQFRDLFNYVVDFHPFISIRFQVSSLLDSGFYFEFLYNTCFEINHPDGIEQSNIMYCTLNNKRPTISSSYLNYMRNGYNYDVKIRDTNRELRNVEYNKSVTQTAINSGLSINPLKILRGAITEGTTYGVYHEQEEYYTRMLEDLQMEKNQEQLKAQKIGVDMTTGGIERTLSINQFPKLSCVIRAPRKSWWKYLEDYFYFYGNKVQYYGVPTHNNRCLFDYLKCKAEFVNRNNVPNEESLQDIISRLGSGVTFIHKFINQYTFDSDYKENVENRLLEIIQESSNTRKQIKRRK